MLRNLAGYFFTTSIMNIFLNTLVARDYDDYYQTDIGKATDKIEKIILSGHLVLVPHGHMLELGCGTGHWTDFFCRQGFHVTAIDESEAMLSIAQNKKIKNVTFAKANATTLPFASNSFSSIASVTMLEFVEDTGNVLDEINRVLKPAGHLILGCLNALSELGKNKQYNEVFQYARFLHQMK